MKGRASNPTAQSSALLAILIIDVEPSARLFAEQARLHQVAQGRTGPILRIAEIAVQDFGDRQHRVEADQIRKLERPEWVTETEPSAGVDVFFFAHAFFEREAGLVEQRNQDAIDQKSRPILANNRLFAEAPRKLEHTLEGGVGRERAPHHLDQ